MKSFAKRHLPKSCAREHKEEARARCLKITEKSLIQHCERRELRLHFEWTKVNQKCQKWSILRVFENLKLAVKQCYQTYQF